ncbi:cytochrome P450 [Daldinia decipiens]|uniref:cytochrome P450 n=1 Tax=Daldinia decipiens TaxID=326647 RepID=UPI0020C37719|nr:cytochrome P450 [Daldinia decipiens]KAI1652390.1 cytochrome P450 [Daldinia decipiens]
MVGLRNQSHALDSESGGLRQSELWVEANLFLVATVDTVKTVLCAVFFYLSRNDGCYKKLVHEIRSTFTVGSEIRGPALTTCHYLQAYTDEALRVSPPASGVLWKCLHGAGDQPFIVDEHIIPQGTVAGTMRDAFAVEYSEVSITVAKTLWYFDFRRATGSLGEIGAGALGVG